jgi:hypothetical protein
MGGLMHASARCCCLSPSVLRAATATMRSYMCAVRSFKGTLTFKDKVVHLGVSVNPPACSRRVQQETLYFQLSLTYDDV